MSALVAREQAALVFIDVQPCFVDRMHGDREALLRRCEHLLMLVGHYELPCVATFEHPVDRNGWLPECLERVFPDGGQRHVKRQFNLCAEPDIRSAIAALDRSQIVVAGAETDVCVLQSTLGLLAAGYQVFLLEDCLFTSAADASHAVARMRQAGAIPSSYKTLHYELKRAVSDVSLHEEWNRRTPGLSFVNPEALG